MIRYNLRMLWWRFFRWVVLHGPTGKEHRKLLECLNQGAFISNTKYWEECQKRGYQIA